MKLIINIPEDTYRAIKKEYINTTDYQTTLKLYFAVKNGTPLPKGHGRLIDGDKLNYIYKGHYDFYRNAYDSFSDMPFDLKARCDELSTVMADIINAKTIIEADKEK